MVFSINLFFCVGLTKNLTESLKLRKSEKKAVVQQLEDENLSIEKQERDKEEKLNRTQYQLRKAMKRLGSRDTSLYEVSNFT